jgi:SAM-dependent methyltransferase
MMAGEFGSWEDAVRWLLTRPEHDQVVRDCYFDQPNAVAAARYEAGGEWQALRPMLRGAGSAAVDVGSGQGITAFALARAGFAVTAVEPDASDLVGRGAVARLATETRLPIRVVAGTAENIPAADMTFDVALARQVLHHTRDLRAACREIHRVLKPGGLFIAARDHVVSSQADLQLFLDSHPLHRLYGGENAFLMNEYIEALSGAGLVVVRVLRSFDSIINYAPHTRETLRAAFVAMAGRLPGAGAVLGALIRSDWLFDRWLSVASRFDGRPGRLISIVCRRPTGSPRG